MVIVHVDGQTGKITRFVPQSIQHGDHYQRNHAPR